MTQKIITQNELDSIAYEIEGTPRYQYSGRGMYGKTCVGIVCEQRDLLRLGYAIGEYIGDSELRDIMLNGYTLDDMGRSIIIYWTGIAIMDGVTDDEEE